MNVKCVLIFILVLILACTLRMYRITQVPTGFFADEAAIGYNAFKLLQSGKDEHGKPWPIFFESIGDYRTPIPIYSNIPSIIVFGLSEFSVRYTTAVYGVLTVTLLFFLGKKLVGVKFGLLCAFLLAISPWHIHMSRWGSEYASYPFFVVLGLLYFIYALERPFYILLSFFIFGLGLYTYYPAWAVIPLFLFGLTVYWFLHNRFKSFRIFMMGLVMFSVTTLPLIFAMKDGTALTRWNSVSHKEIPIPEKLKKFGQLYLDHFDVKYLFFTGDLAYPGHFITRQFVRDRGVFSYWQVPFILFGMFLTMYLRKKQWVLVLFLLILYPLGSVLTVEGPTTTRSIIGIIPFTLLCGYGLYVFVERFMHRYKIVLLCFIPIFFYCFLEDFHAYLYQYYVEYPSYSSDFWGWQYGPKDIISYFINSYDNYDEFFMTGDFNGAYIFVPFYTQDNYPKIKAGWWNEYYRKDKKQLFAVKPNELEKEGYPKVFNIVKKLFYPDGNTAFLIGSPREE